MIGALAVIGGLLFTGIATYFGARVSQDQLEQSREDAEREARSQARQVSYWFDLRSGRAVLHVMNRSPDPVDYALMRYELRIFSADNSHTATMANVEFVTGPLPPCSIKTVEPADLRLSDGTGKQTRLPNRTMIAENPYFAFTDRDGRVWGRLEGRLSPRLVSEEALNKHKENRYKMSGILVGIPKQAPAPECGDDTTK
ncbi:hypothetical protein [Streptomyces sp. NPDC002676]